jgi:hypothetical protein
MTDPIKHTTPSHPATAPTVPPHRYGDRRQPDDLKTVAPAGGRRTGSLSKVHSLVFLRDPSPVAAKDCQDSPKRGAGPPHWLLHCRLEPGATSGTDCGSAPVGVFEFPKAFLRVATNCPRLPSPCNACT